jgi:alanine dehydrogenase
LVERDAGSEAFFSDADYQDAGAQIVYDGEEFIRRSDLLCCVGRIDPAQAKMLKSGATVCGFQHLAVAGQEIVVALRERQATLIGYEMIEDDEGEAPVLMPFSEMAGHLAIQHAARYLQNEEGGRGIVLGSVPCVAPPTVLILGAGRVSRTAARHALQIGAHVVIIGHDVTNLQRIHNEHGGRIVTILAGSDRLEKYTAIADVVIGAVRIRGGRAPFLVSENMVRGMKKGSIILDISIDQGGCVETSRPTTLPDPVFERHGVIHYCVPNMTANVARTASRALASSALPYLLELAQCGTEEALRQDPGLARGVYMYRGELVHQRLGDMLDLSVTPIEKLLGD